ncbi:hypothetical protein, partial [Endozoicomonas sp. SESOKO4]|uniref:hypothetical protein n=1 Tax=Endozoicomonas sp. SESOKO4 TaxID=2828745 RepID=UPI002148EFE6
FKNSLAIVNNPQTNILRYRKQHVAEFLDVAFKGIPNKEIEKKYINRLSLLHMFEYHKNMPEISYYQNLADKFHLNNHLLPFLEGLESSCFEKNKISLNTYYDGDKGHSPMSKIQALEVIRKELNLK